ncbi:hypothetical protein HYT84_03645 [Candidatus Micrarchaeota archaeon]|nr:hypothetical protein [Candidatus Micrarchaeota archaeon]
MEYVKVAKEEYEQLLIYKQLITYVEEELHEKEYREDFIKEVEKIKQEVKKGKKISFKSKEEMNAYLDRL